MQIGYKATYTDMLEVNNTFRFMTLRFLIVTNTVLLM